MTSPFPSCTADDVAWLTEAQMIAVDRVMIDTLLIDLTQMMENAGRSLARLVIDRFAPSSVTVLAGAGGNGGGGLVAARHLANRGVDVSVILGQGTEHFAPIPGHQYSILRRMGVPVKPDAAQADVVIDALIGYSLRGAPRGRIGELMAATSGLGTRVVSLDTPSGLDVTDGSVPGLVVDADATLTLALPKIGLRDAPQVGELYLADISVPPSVYTSMGIGPAPDFSRRAILRIEQ